MKRLGFAAEVFDEARSALIDDVEIVLRKIANDASAVNDLRIDANDRDAG